MTYMISKYDISQFGQSWCLKKRMHPSNQTCWSEYGKKKSSQNKKKSNFLYGHQKGPRPFFWLPEIFYTQLFFYMKLQAIVSSIFIILLLIHSNFHCKLTCRLHTHTHAEFLNIHRFMYRCTVLLYRTSLRVGWSAVQKLSVNKTSIASCMFSEQLSSQNNSNLYSF